jgi:hypothetical protein
MIGADNAVADVGAVQAIRGYGVARIAITQGSVFDYFAETVSAAGDTFTGVDAF